MDLSARVLKNLRMNPTLQQGGTQTIQQSIYLAHENPCGVNFLIFEEMGDTKIRYIDLKNYLDDILGQEEMRLLFEQVRVAGTEYINNPENVQFLFQYLYSIQHWGEKAITFLPVPTTYYPGYRIRFTVYDGSGCALYDSNFPYLNIIQESGGVYYRTQLEVVPNPHVIFGKPSLYKLSIDYLLMPYLDTTNFYSFLALYSDYVINQMPLPETTMCISSLLVDSANTRTFGVPRYGFSARPNAHGIAIGGIGYHCVNFIDIRTTPNPDGETTLIESIYARLSIEEDTLFFGAANLDKVQDAKETILKTFPLTLEKDT